MMTPLSLANTPAPVALWQSGSVQHFDDEQNLRPDDELKGLLELELHDHRDVTAPARTPTRSAI